MSVKFFCDRCDTSAMAEGGDAAPRIPRSWRRQDVPWRTPGGGISANQITRTLCTACVAQLAKWVEEVQS